MKFIVLLLFFFSIDAQIDESALMALQLESRLTTTVSARSKKQTFLDNFTTCHRLYSAFRETTNNLFSLRGHNSVKFQLRLMRNTDITTACTTIGNFEQPRVRSNNPLVDSAKIATSRNNDTHCRTNFTLHEYNIDIDDFNYYVMPEIGSDGKASYPSNYDRKCFQTRCESLMHVFAEAEIMMDFANTQDHTEVRAGPFITPEVREINTLAYTAFGLAHPIALEREMIIRQEDGDSRYMIDHLNINGSLTTQFDTGGLIPYPMSPDGNNLISAPSPFCVVP